MTNPHCVSLGFIRYHYVTFIRCLWLQYIAHSIRFRSVQESLRFGLHSICMMKWLKNIQNLIFMSCSCAKPWEAWWIGSCKLAYVCVYLLHIYRYICMCMCIYTLYIHILIWSYLHFFAKAPRLSLVATRAFLWECGKGECEGTFRYAKLRKRHWVRNISHVQRKGQRNIGVHPSNAPDKKRCVLPSETWWNIQWHMQKSIKNCMNASYSLPHQISDLMRNFLTRSSTAAEENLPSAELALQNQNSSGNLDMLRSSQVNMESDLILGPRWS